MPHHLVRLTSQQTGQPAEISPMILDDFDVS
jgi:hypothetical protein